jgi:hypothetical protein
MFLSSGEGGETPALLCPLERGNVNKERWTMDRVQKPSNFEFCHAVLQWLRRYVRSRKVTGSRPYEVIFFFSIYLIHPAAQGPGV